MQPPLETESQEDMQCVEEILEQYDGYIKFTALKFVTYIRKYTHADVTDLEIDELVQLTRVKLWQALLQKKIVNLKGYIRRIVHNESVSMGRKRMLYPLPEDEERELYQGEILVKVGTDMDDPALEMEQKEMAAHYVKHCVCAALSLPECQKRAFLLSLRDRLDDIIMLADTCRLYNVDLATITGPTNAQELHSTRSSISIARRKVRAAFSKRYNWC